MTGTKFAGGSSWSSAYIYSTDSGRQLFVKTALGRDSQAMFKGEAQGLRAMHGELRRRHGGQPVRSCGTWRGCWQPRAQLWHLAEDGTPPRAQLRHLSRCLPENNALPVCSCTACQAPAAICISPRSNQHNPSARGVPLWAAAGAAGRRRAARQRLLHRHGVPGHAGPLRPG